MIGKPIDRIDGPLKVTGRATYAYEHRCDAPPLYGVIVGATIARGRIRALDTSAAERAPGVKLVLTHENAPAQGAPDPNLPWKALRACPVLVGPEIRAYGEAVALVVAESFEEARAAASAIEVRYAQEPGNYALAQRLEHAYAPKSVNGGMETDTQRGDFESAFRGARVKLDLRYTTPHQSPQPLEPHACLAIWKGEDLTVYMGTQMVGWARTAIASTLSVPEQRVHVEAPFVGGGFGSKLCVHPETILAALAARVLGEPVKVAMMRPQMCQLLGHRPAELQRVRLGAERDGQLLALAHEVTIATCAHEEYAEQTASTTRSLYAAPHRLTRHRLAVVDLPPGDDMRGPGEVPGLLAVESAMDELAHMLGVDPIELRVRNEPKSDPETGRPFSERRLVECMREGARRLGWERRQAQPARVRDGRWLVGMGMAAGIRKHFQTASSVKVVLDASGVAIVRCDLPDIGTGHYTVLTQVAAEALGFPLERVRVELGRSDFPATNGSGGSWAAPSTAVALHRACSALRDKLRAGENPAGLEATGSSVGMADDPNFANYSQHTYGAYFAEVGVDADTAEVRLRRMLGVFSVGRVLNPKTARSQLIGGMIWGVSSALHEELVPDLRTGAFVNRDFAGYLVPVHADIPAIDAVMLDGFDEKANMLGIKGIGEVATCGSGAAVANAVFNATGVRVRDFPITIEKLLPHLPRLDH